MVTMRDSSHIIPIPRIFVQRDKGFNSCSLSGAPSDGPACGYGKSCYLICKIIQSQIKKYGILVTAVLWEYYN